MYILYTYILIMTTKKVDKEAQSQRNKRLEKKAIQRFRHEHLSKYDAPLGQRTCDLNIADTCVGTDDEALFREKSSRCTECNNHMQRTNYYKNKTTTNRVGRPADSLEVKKKKKEEREKAKDKLNQDKRKANCKQQ